MQGLLPGVVLVVFVSVTPASGQEAVQMSPSESSTTAPSDAVAPAESEPQPALDPFRRLFGTIARDLKQLPSRENGMVLLNGGLLALAAVPLDHLATLGASSSPLLKRSFAGWGKALGREWIQGGGALAAYVAGRVWDKPRMSAAAGDLIEAQLVSVTVTQGLKFATSRTRPDGEARSFPSGHASAAFATATVLGRHFGRKAAVPAYALAAYTSASRLQANSHYASDVIFGAALGMVVGRTATLGLGRTRLQLAPVAIGGGIGVTVTR